MNKKSLESFMKLQMPDKLKIIKSDFVINTSIPENHTNIQVLRALTAIKAARR